VANLRDWLDDRTGYRGVLKGVLLLNFPVDRAARWRYVWGGSLSLLFLVELVTGTLLMTVYSPSEASAWGSVHYLEHNIPWGHFIRGLHHNTSHMMLIVILIHAASVVFTAGYRRPKEFTYWTGLVLGFLMLGLAISGNPLPWDRKGYWAYQIETEIAGAMPLMGAHIRDMLVGGSEFGNLTLTRLYTLHVIVLPAAAILFLVIHIALMRREKLKLAENQKNDPAVVSPEMEPYWPYQTARNLIVGAILMAMILLQMQVTPMLKGETLDASELDVPVSAITQEAPADSGSTYVARPEWYVRFLFELRHMAPKEQEVYITAGLPVAIVLFMFLMPFYEKILGSALSRWFAATGFLIGVVGVLALTFWGAYKDVTDESFQASKRRELKQAGRAIWLAEQMGVPPEGPMSLLRSDPLTAGPELFKTHCASCHTWNGHDGTGVVVMEEVDGKKVPATPTASDLSGFGTTDWIAGFLTNPADGKYFGHMHRIAGGEEFTEGSMVYWAEENVGEGFLNEEQIRAVAALLAEEAERADAGPLDDETRALGVKVFAGGLLDEDGEELEFGNCLRCHEMSSGDPEEAGSDGEDTGLNLNGYASEKWLREFIRNPAGEDFYPYKNVMPGFDAAEISEEDLKLLVRWMRNDWPRSQQAAKAK